MQPNAITVQEVLSNALATVTGGAVSNIMGCGRTDTGVHASSFVLHFDCSNEKVIEQPKFLYSLNGILPNDIVAHNYIPVADTAHARFDATQREYKYIISLSPNPFIPNLAVKHFRRLNVHAMNQAATYLVGKKDFTSFCKLHSDNNNNMCELYTANWQLENDFLVFTIAANRFLRNMVRAIVGTMLLIGEEKIEPQEIQNILNAKSRSAAGASAPARGLYLHNITYPYIKNEFSTNSLSFWKGI